MKKLLIKFIHFSLFIIYSTVAIAQDNYIDSLKRILQTEKEDTQKVYTIANISIRLSIKKDSVAAFQYATNALQLAQKLNFTRGEAYACFSLSFFYGNTRKPDSALKYAFKALSLYEEINDKANTAFICQIVGDYYDNGLNNEPEALVYLYKALKLYEQLGDKKSIAYCLYQIGAKNYWLENYDESLKNYQQCLQLSKEIITPKVLLNLIST